MKTVITGLFLISLFAFCTTFVAGQDEQSGTYIEESGEKQDSIKRTDIFDFESDFDKDKSSSTGIIIGIVAVVLVGGGIIYVTTKKKKK